VFCEVFLDDVHVPAEALLGAPGQGWRVAMSALTDERDMIWIMNWLTSSEGGTVSPKPCATGPPTTCR